MINTQLFKSFVSICFCLLMLSSSVANVSSQTDDETLAVAWSPSGDRIATAHQDGTVKIWDAQTNQVLHTMHGHTQKALFLVWKPDGTQLISISLDNYAKVWDTATGDDLSTLEIPYATAVIGAAWSLQGDQIFTWGFDTNPNFYVWDASTFQLLSERDYGGDTLRIVWSPERTIGALVNAAGQVILVDAQTLEIIRRLQEPEDELGLVAGVYEVDWHSSGNQLISGTARGDIRIWNVSTGEILMSMRATASLEQAFDIQIVRALRYSDDEAYIYSVAGDGTIRTFDAETGAIIAEAQLPRLVLDADWSPDGTQLAYSSEGNSTFTILSHPTAHAGPDQTLWTASGSALVTLDATASTDPDGSIVSYDWQLDGSTIATDTNPQVELPVGEHTITLLVTDNDGLVDTDEVVIDVREVTPDILRARIAECVTQQGIQRSLNAKVDALQWSAFIHEVEALRGKQIDEDCADELIAMAQALRAPTLTHAALYTQIETCVDNPGLRNSLEAKADAEQWAALINEVEAQRGKQLDEACADELIALAEELLAAE